MLLERFYQPLYDSAEVTGQSTCVEFFKTAIENGKTIADTNMDKAGSLPYPNYFEIHGVSVKPNLTADLAQVKKFADRSWFRLHIGTKDYLIVPLSLVLDLCETTKTSTDSELELLKMLLKQKEQQPIFKLPEGSELDLTPNLKFNAEINSSSMTHIPDIFKLTTILYGYYKRPVH